MECCVQEKKACGRDHLLHKTVQEQFDDMREHGVDNRGHGCIDGGEGWGGHLGAHEGSAQQPPASYDILHSMSLCQQKTLESPDAMQEVPDMTARLMLCGVAQETSNLINNGAAVAMQSAQMALW